MCLETFNAGCIFAPRVPQVDAVVRYSYKLKEERVIAVVDALIDTSTVEASISLLEALVGMFQLWSGVRLVRRVIDSWIN